MNLVVDPSVCVCLVLLIWLLLIARSRNRLLEQILADVEINCPFIDKGCTAKVKRKDVTEHKASCKYGKEIPLCKRLCFKNCNFKVNMGNREMMFSHLENEHNNIKPMMGNRERIVAGISATSLFKDKIFKHQSGVFSQLIKFESFPDRDSNDISILFAGERNKDFVSWMLFDLCDVRHTPQILKTSPSIMNSHIGRSPSTATTPSLSLFTKNVFLKKRFLSRSVISSSFIIGNHQHNTPSHSGPPTPLEKTPSRRPRTVLCE